MIYGATNAWCCCHQWDNYNECHDVPNGRTLYVILWNSGSSDMVWTTMWSTSLSRNILHATRVACSFILSNRVQVHSSAQLSSTHLGLSMDHCMLQRIAWGTPVYICSRMMRPYAFVHRRRGPCGDVRHRGGRGGCFPGRRVVQYGALGTIKYRLVFNNEYSATTRKNTYFLGHICIYMSSNDASICLRTQVTMTMWRCSSSMRAIWMFSGMTSFRYDLNNDAK